METGVSLPGGCEVWAHLQLWLEKKECFGEAVEKKLEIS